MFCKKCGSWLDDNAVFCPKCGERCSVCVVRNEQTTIIKPKLSVGEKFLRFINVISIIFAFLFAIMNFMLSNIIGGIIILLTAIFIIIFVFRKKQMLKIKGMFDNVILRKLVVTLIYLLLPVIIFASVGISTTLNDKNSNNIAITCAESILKGRLKNPESLQIHKSEVGVDFEWGGYHYYSITIDYSAQNGFGGYNRDEYDVLVKVDKTTNRASEATTEEYLDAIKQYNNSK